MWTCSSSSGNNSSEGHSDQRPYPPRQGVGPITWELWQTFQIIHFPQHRWTFGEGLKVLKPIAGNWILTCVCCQVGLRDTSSKPFKSHDYHSFLLHQRGGKLLWVLRWAGKETRTSLSSPPANAELSAVFAPFPPLYDIFEGYLEPFMLASPGDLQSKWKPAWLTGDKDSYGQQWLPVDKKEKFL
jgi:hypothetical protein